MFIVCIIYIRTLRILDYSVLRCSSLVACRKRTGPRERFDEHEGKEESVKEKEKAEIREAVAAANAKKTPTASPTFSQMNYI